MVMPLEEFKYIMEQIKAHSEKLERISDFFEKELCTDSWCLFNIGEELASTLYCMLADHFNCWWISEDTESKEKVDNILKGIGLPPSKGTSLEWWDTSKKRYENDIEYWLYEEPQTVKDENGKDVKVKRIIVDEEEVPITTLEEFYDYLVKYCVDKNKS